MSGDLFSSKSQTARDSYEDILRKIADNFTPDAGGTNFTIAGNLTVGGALTANGTFAVGAFSPTGLLSGTNVAFTSIASIAEANIYSAVATDNALILNSTVLSNPTVAPLKLIASTASQSFFNFVGAIGSTASLNLAANKVAAFVQVTFSGGPAGQGIGYLPIFTGVI